MRRASLTLSALLLSAALALAGCSGTTGDGTASASVTGAPPLSDVDCADVTIDTTPGSLPQVTGDAGAEPTVTWADATDSAAAPDTLSSKVLVAGEGAEVAASDIVVSHYVGWQWGSTTPFDSSWTRGSLAAFSLDQVITGWRCGLVGLHVGDRVELSVPADYAYGTDPSAGRPTGTLVFVVDLVDTGSAASFDAATADATMVGEQALSDRGITVSGPLGAPATVAVTAGATEPTETEFIVLAQGSGEPVAADSTIMLQMAFSSWDGSVSQSSWDLGQPPQVLSMADATGLPGLVGVPGGSRVVALLPADAASGTPAFAYVVDIERVY